MHVYVLFFLGVIQAEVLRIKNLYGLGISIKTLITFETQEPDLILQIIQINKYILRTQLSAPKTSWILLMFDHLPPFAADPKLVIIIRRKIVCSFEYESILLGVPIVCTAISKILHRNHVQHSAVPFDEIFLL